MAFLKIEKALFDAAHGGNDQCKLTNDDRVLWSVIREYNDQGKPLVMSSKNLACAAGVTISKLRRGLKKLEALGLLVRKAVPNNPQNLQALWVAPLGELTTALHGDHVSTWSERSQNLTVAPELLPPSMQAQAAAAATADEIADDRENSKVRRVDGVAIFWDCDLVAHLWRDFAAAAWDRANGHISTRSLQWLANDLQKASTNYHAAYYLQGALTSGAHRINVPDQDVQKEHSNRALQLFANAERTMKKQAQEKKREQWLQSLQEIGQTFEDTLSFELLQKFEFDAYDTESDTVTLLSTDYEQTVLFEELGGDLQNALKSKGWSAVAYKLPRVAGKVVLKCGQWQAQKEAYAAQFSRAFVIEEIAKKKNANLSNAIAFESADDVPALDNPAVTGLLDLPWADQEFAKALLEFIEYQSENHDIHHSSENIERIAFQLAIQCKTSSEAIELLHLAIANGWKSFNADNLQRKATSKAAEFDYQF